MNQKHQLFNTKSKFLFCISVVLSPFFSLSYGNPAISDATNTHQTETQKNSKIEKFIPKGYKIFEEIIYGDLNKDGIQDSVIMIKATDKNNISKDAEGKELDKNRRGIIVLLGEKDDYKLAVKNLNCFSSENEDGGVYFPPELSLNIKKGNLYLHYAHGRYGHWTYTFRFQNNDLELIGYDATEGGAVIDKITSINYLTKKKVVQENIEPNAESGKEVFKTNTSKISPENLLKLSEIKDFDELNLSD